MALKPTIYKFKIDLADIDRDHYNALNLTVALHPSETVQRMMARILAFSMNDKEDLTFTKGLSTTDEPDIWARTMDGRISLWIEIGEPSLDRIKKAVRTSGAVKVYAFHFKSDTWWAREAPRIAALGVPVYRFGWKGIDAFSQMAARTLACTITVSDRVIYVSSDRGECQVPWTILSNR